MSNKLTSTTIGLAVLSGFVFATLAVPTGVSAGTGTGACQQAFKAAAKAGSAEGTVGDAVSDGFFGNEPNLLNTDTNLDLGPEQVDPGSSAGFVAPSLSPGPFITPTGFLALGPLIAAGANDCAEVD